MIAPDRLVHAKALRLLFALAFTAVVFAATAAAAQNGAAHQPAHARLLPAGHVIADAPKPIDLAALRRGKAVIVPSANFNDYSRNWTTAYGEGQNRAFRRFSETDLAGYEGMRNSSDPGVLAGRVTAALRPYFASVGVAADLVEARDAGADYFIILDYWGRYGGMGASTLHTRGGVLVLDRSLRRVIAVETEARTKRPAMPFMSSSAKDGADVMTRGYVMGLDAASAALRAGVLAQLGPAP